MQKSDASQQEEQEEQQADLLQEDADEVEVEDQEDEQFDSQVFADQEEDDMEAEFEDVPHVPHDGLKIQEAELGEHQMQPAYLIRIHVIPDMQKRV